jgi:hypothetical protein
MRFSLRASGAVAVLLVVAAFTQAGPAHAQWSVDSSRGFWVVMTSGESFTDAVRQSARTSGGGQVMATLEKMIRRVEAGHAVYVPQSSPDGVVNLAATVSQLQAALSAARSVSP